MAQGRPEIRAHPHPCLAATDNVVGVYYHTSDKRGLSVGKTVSLKTSDWVLWHRAEQRVGEERISRFPGRPGRVSRRGAGNRHPRVEHPRHAPKAPTPAGTRSGLVYGYSGPRAAGPAPGPVHHRGPPAPVGGRGRQPALGVAEAFRPGGARSTPCHGGPLHHGEVPLPQGLPDDRSGYGGVPSLARALFPRGANQGRARRP